MRIVIECPRDELIVLKALVEYIRAGLEATGHLAAVEGEDRYHTERRDLLGKLCRLLPR